MTDGPLDPPDWGTLVPDWLACRKSPSELSMGAKLVYGFVARRSAQGDRFPTVAEIAVAVGSEVRQTQRYLAELRELELLQTERGALLSDPNDYLFLAHPWVIPARAEQSGSTRPACHLLNVQVVTPVSPLPGAQAGPPAQAKESHALASDPESGSGIRSQSPESGGEAGASLGLLGASASPHPDTLGPGFSGTGMPERDPVPLNPGDSAVPSATDSAGEERELGAVGRHGVLEAPERAPAPDPLRESPGCVLGQVPAQERGVSSGGLRAAPEPGSRAALEALIAETKARTMAQRTVNMAKAAARDQKLANLKGTGPVEISKRRVLGKLEDTWRTAMQVKYPSLVFAPWAAKERGQVQSLVDKYNPAIVQYALTYVVNRWDKIQERFLRGKGGVPSLGFLVKLHDVIVIEAQRAHELETVQSEWEAWYLAHPGDAYPPAELEARYKQVKKEIATLGVA